MYTDSDDRAFDEDSGSGFEGEWDDVTPGLPMGSPVVPAEDARGPFDPTQLLPPSQPLPPPGTDTLTIPLSAIAAGAAEAPAPKRRGVIRRGKHEVRARHSFPASCPFYFVSLFHAYLLYSWANFGYFTRHTC